jgi:hypothetical protein
MSYEHVVVRFILFPFCVSLFFIKHVSLPNSKFSLKFMTTESVNLVLNMHSSRFIFILLST